MSRHMRTLAWLEREEAFAWMGPRPEHLHECEFCQYITSYGCDDPDCQAGKRKLCAFHEDAD